MPQARLAFLVLSLLVCAPTARAFSGSVEFRIVFPGTSQQKSAQKLDRKPDAAEVEYLTGVEHYKAGRLKDAIEAVKRAIKLKPGFALAHFNLGVT